jgi:hypothetical protein
LTTAKTSELCCPSLRQPPPKLFVLETFDEKLTAARQAHVECIQLAELAGTRPSHQLGHLQARQRLICPS